MVYNKDSQPILLNDAKFFVLDSQHQQLHRVTMDEIKYALELSVAQNSRGSTYPAPPPASPRQYTITGTESGSYTITDLGAGMTVASGTSTSTYTVTPQPDYNQLGYSLGLAIRKHLDKKHNEKVLKQAQQQYANIYSNYFHSEMPVIAGERRTGGINYYGANTLGASLRVVLFLTDPATKKDVTVSFDFH